MSEDTEKELDEELEDNLDDMTEEDFDAILYKATRKLEDEEAQEDDD